MDSDTSSPSSVTTMAGNLPQAGHSSQYNVARLLVYGLIFHVAYIASVFDCYFTSPVVKGMKSFQLSTGESQRLVLIVGDGLRSDLLFSFNAFPSVLDAPEVVAPHLRSIVETRGAFGVSHTHVPTESRPGHVALIGGMYEDVSAVTKGWKTNPVDFDSVFNQSSYTFSFGSPDILPMFSRGATPGKVKTWTYNEEDEDFTKDAAALDVWVLDHLRELFSNASNDAVLDSQLRSDKTVFFLHLLGLDTTGHSYKPHSKEYMNNIQTVDTIVRETEELFAEFFRDEETSFIFTADHGMATRGNHGDGDPDNTRTPLIAWGRGVRGPLPDSSPSSHDSYSHPWRLNHILRRDVEQADVAALMAALIGINWPVNSVGVLPDVDPTRPGYLLPRNGEETLAHAALLNAKVILEQYLVKHELKKEHTLLYSPFSNLEKATATGEPARASLIRDIEELIHTGHWYDARQKSSELVKSALEGLRYLQTYDRLLIQAIVTAGFLGWAAYASLYISRPLDLQLHPHPAVKSIKITAMSILLGFWILFVVQRSPLTFYLYITFPCYFWQEFIGQMMQPANIWFQSKDRSYAAYAIFVLQSVLVIAALQSMVAAYTHRSIWSLGLVLMGIVWPLFAWPKGMLSGHPRLSLLWAATCLVTAIFPLLPVDKEENLRLILLGATAMLLAGLAGLALLSQQRQGASSDSESDDTYSFFAVQLVLLALARVITKSSVQSLQAKTGLPLLNQLSGWVVLVLSSLLPFLWPVQHSQPLSKILALFLAFGPCFVILSISVEGLFHLAYSSVLILWIEVEATIREHRRIGCNAKTAYNVYKFQPDDLRIALFFLFFVQVAFFGTGNVASISSFYLQPVYRLVPVFSPFLMASLLIFKVVAPYVILSASFATLNFRLRLPPFSLLLVALTLTDGMTMSFFFNVTDTGSWLEIGQSISFFCITSLLLLWSAGICATGEILMADIRLPPGVNITKEE